MQSAVFVLAVFQFVLLIFSLSFHECAHAWVASLLGDQTARLQGRVTLNPMYHVDPIGTLLFPALVIFGPVFGLHMPIMLIGWAKPTPVITRNFRKIVRDDNLVSLAGPASNLILASVATVVLLAFARFAPGGPQVALQSFLVAVGEPNIPNANPVAVLASLALIINLSLLFFNLLPIPPLDGSRVVRNLLPYNAAQTYDQISGWVSLLLMMFVGGYVLNMAVTPLLSFVFHLLLRMQPGPMILQ